MSTRLTDCDKAGSWRRIGGIRCVRGSAVVVLVDNEASNIAAVSLQVGHMCQGTHLRSNGAELVSRVTVRTNTAAHRLACVDIVAPEQTATCAVSIVVCSVAAMAGVTEKYDRYHCVWLIVSHRRLPTWVLEDSLPFFVMFAGMGWAKSMILGMLASPTAYVAQIGGVPQNVLLVI